jgi:NADPH:quinone reductase-like Zn-dependent oxidoreductase
MRALRFFEYGGPEVLRLDQDAPVPEPAKGQVLVRVAGAGLNPADWKIREGLFKEFWPMEFPSTVGREFSGTVEKLGPGVTEFAVGDEVYGVATGSCADYVAANVTEMAKRPPSMDPADAAAVPVAALTAWQALFDHGKLQNGMNVMIKAASGGVGTFAVQIAKWAGANVLATASVRNFHLMRELGAVEVIDYRQFQIWAGIRNLDLVLELRPEGQKTDLALLKPGGILVTLAGPPPVWEARQEAKIAVGMSMEPNPEQLTKIAGLIEDLKIRPVISTVAPFEKAIELQKEVQDGHVIGKLVCRMSE